MKRLALILAALTALATVAVLGAALFLYGGLYDVAAATQHLRPTYALMEIAMRQAIRQRAAAIVVPPLEDAALRERGLALFAAQCVRCHGAPGVAPDAFALGLRPAAANLAHTARQWPAREIYWAVKNGIKMTGMPAWAFRLSERELWAIVAFVMELPTLSPADYRARLAQNRGAHDEATALRPPDAQRGKRALLGNGCITCHQIPGVVGPDAPVGPPLEGMATRAFIAGNLSNTPDNMVRWLRFPQAVNPLSAMPDLGVGEQDARDMAAYLATLR